MDWDLRNEKKGRVERERSRQAHVAQTFKLPFFHFSLSKTEILELWLVVVVVEELDVGSVSVWWKCKPQASGGSLLR